MPRFKFFVSNFSLNFPPFYVFHHFTFFISSVIYLSLRHLYYANNIKIGAYEAPIPNYSHHFPSLFFWFSCRFIGLKCTQTLLGGGRSAPSKQIIKLVTQLPSDSWLHYFFFGAWTKTKNKMKEKNKRPVFQCFERDFRSLSIDFCCCISIIYLLRKRGPVNAFKQIKWNRRPTL